MHYNMADPSTIGLSDTTTLNMTGEPSVERVARYALMDPFLESLFEIIPEIIPAGESDYSYTWSLSGYDVLRTAGFDGLADDVRVEAVLPHMHDYGNPALRQPDDWGRDPVPVRGQRLGLQLAVGLLLRRAVPDHLSR